MRAAAAARWAHIQLSPTTLSLCVPAADSCHDSGDWAAYLNKAKPCFEAQTSAVFVEAQTTLTASNLPGALAFKHPTTVNPVRVMPVSHAYPFREMAKQCHVAQCSRVLSPHHPHCKKLSLTVPPPHFAQLITCLLLTRLPPRCASKTGQKGSIRNARVPAPAGIQPSPRFPQALRYALPPPSFF